MRRRLIVLTNDLPYPPNYGHKVDQYNRWSGFAEAGWSLRLICWRSPQDPAARLNDIEALGHVFEAIDELPIRYNITAFVRRLVRLIRYPSHIGARVPEASVLRRLTSDARAFGPDAIILDGIYGAVLGEALARKCGVPVIVRGHNVEHAYFAGQIRAAADVKTKAKWLLALLGLRRYETALLRRVAWTFDISFDDIRYWQEQGIDNISWAPTIYPGRESGTLIPAVDRSFDVAYIGNMRLPNNLEGLRWFIRDVLPLLRVMRPNTTYCFAGANPSLSTQALFAEAPEITLVPNAPSADEILANGRVLINPILSGSGVNVKSIEMLRYDAPIVTTAVGAQGFGAEIDRQFIVALGATAFAAAIVEALAEPCPPPGRDEARKLFGDAGLDLQIALIGGVAGFKDPALSMYPLGNDH